jgi:hypothetical protein
MGDYQEKFKIEITPALESKDDGLVVYVLMVNDLTKETGDFTFVNDCYVEISGTIQTTISC